VLRGETLRTHHQTFSVRFEKSTVTEAVIVFPTEKLFFKFYFISNKNVYRRLPLRG
jgi:hypothetical protein